MAVLLILNIISCITSAQPSIKCTLLPVLLSSPCQAAALQHFATIIEEVLKVMEPNEFS